MLLYWVFFLFDPVFDIANLVILPLNKYFQMIAFPVWALGDDSCHSYPSFISLDPIYVIFPKDLHAHPADNKSIWYSNAHYAYWILSPEA